MRRFLYMLKRPVIVGLIAASLLFIDGVIGPIIVAGGAFAWMAFISWTVFAAAPRVDRFKAFPGYLIGFAIANAIVYLGAFFNNIAEVNVLKVAMGGILAVFLMNIVIMFFEYAQKIFLDSMAGIFVGIALTFSGAGIGLATSDPKLLFLIFLYGALGHLCAIAMNTLTTPPVLAHDTRGSHPKEPLPCGCANGQDASAASADTAKDVPRG